MAEAVSIKTGPLSAKDAKQEDSSVDQAVGVFEGWWAFIRPNIRRFYTGLLRITLISLFAVVLLGLVLGIIAFAGYSALGYAGIAIDGIVSFVGAILFMLIALIIIGWLSASIHMSAYDFTKASLEGGEFSIRSSFDRLKWKVLGYNLAYASIMLAGMVPYAVFCAIVVLVLYLSSGGDWSALSSFLGLYVLLILYLLAYLYYFAFHIAFTFLSQFWVFGFIFEGRGVVDSLKRSVSLIRMNLAGVLVFDLIFVVLFYAVSIPIWLASFVLLVPLQIVRAVMVFIDPIAGLALLALSYLLMSIISLLGGVLIQCYALPTMYLFWKKRIEAPLEEKNEEGKGKKVKEA